jgi:hypothetical protein
MHSQTLSLLCKISCLGLQPRVTQYTHLFIHFHFTSFLLNTITTYINISSLIKHHFTNNVQGECLLPISSLLIPASNSPIPIHLNIHLALSSCLSPAVPFSATQTVDFTQGQWNQAQVWLRPHLATVSATPVAIHNFFITFPSLWCRSQVI